MPGTVSAIVHKGKQVRDRSSFSKLLKSNWREQTLKTLTSNYKIMHYELIQEMKGAIYGSKGKGGGGEKERATCRMAKR